MRGNFAVRTLQRGFGKIHARKKFRLDPECFKSRIFGYRSDSPYRLIEESSKTAVHGMVQRAVPFIPAVPRPLPLGPGGKTATEDVGLAGEVPRGKDLSTECLFSQIIQNTVDVAVSVNS